MLSLIFLSLLKLYGQVQDVILLADLGRYGVGRDEL